VREVGGIKSQKKLSVNSKKETPSGSKYLRVKTAKKPKLDEKSLEKESPGRKKEQKQATKKKRRDPAKRKSQTEFQSFWREKHVWGRGGKKESRRDQQ